MFIHILLGVGNDEFRVRACCLPIESLGVILTDCSASGNPNWPVILAAAGGRPQLHNLRRESARIYSYEGPDGAGGDGGGGGGAVVRRPNKKKSSSG